ncbi:hypothetical protein CesoFtcFv8_016710 [Champsocephalus esox]|uniref:Uncharacterized protein n=1 Tax=Champsocephalus esox TaxID=159716 RepID=A0AAN8GQR4_9TELE|nr:hypothetical protein CesoFtcFv8_016710 [Champsocephalus esox]
MRAWTCKERRGERPSWALIRAMISSPLAALAGFPPISWAMNWLDDSPVCMHSSMFSPNPKNSLYSRAQSEFKSAP